MSRTQTFRKADVVAKKAEEYIRSFLLKHHNLDMNNLRNGKKTDGNLHLQEMSVLTEIKYETMAYKTNNITPESISSATYGGVGCGFKNDSPLWISVWTSESGNFETVNKLLFINHMELQVVISEHIQNDNGIKHNADKREVFMNQPQSEDGYFYELGQIVLVNLTRDIYKKMKYWIECEIKGDRIHYKTSEALLDDMKQKSDNTFDAWLATIVNAEPTQCMEHGKMIPCMVSPPFHEKAPKRTEEQAKTLSAEQQSFVSQFVKAECELINTLRKNHPILQEAITVKFRSDLHFQMDKNRNYNGISKTDEVITLDQASRIFNMIKKYAILPTILEKNQEFLLFRMKHWLTSFEAEAMLQFEQKSATKPQLEYIKKLAEKAGIQVSRNEIMALTKEQASVKIKSFLEQ